MSLWLSIPVYWVLLWAASRRKKAYPLPFRFLEGVILAYLCFLFLPQAFLGSLPMAGLGAVLGIALSVWVEGRCSRDGVNKELRCGSIFAITFLFEGLFPHMWALPRSILGGMALYCACSGLFPEGHTLKETVLSALGGIFGFILGVAICFA